MKSGHGLPQMNARDTDLKTETRRVATGDFGIIGIENGCLCTTPDYAGQPGRLPRRASVLGWTELIQENGVSDPERTNFIPFSACKEQSDRVTS